MGFSRMGQCEDLLHKGKTIKGVVASERIGIRCNPFAQRIDTVSDPEYAPEILSSRSVAEDFGWSGRVLAKVL